MAPQIIDDADTTVLAEYDVDPATLLDPFAEHEVLLGGLDPDVPATVAPAQTDTFGLRSLVGARYRVDEGSAVLLPRGYSAFGLYAEAPMPDAPAGAVTVYTKFFGSVGDARPPVTRQPVVVGEFDADTLRDALGEASFMPLGEYDIPGPSPLRRRRAGDLRDRVRRSRDQRARYR